MRLAAVQSMANTVPLLSHQSLKEEEFKVFSAFKDMAGKNCVSYTMNLIVFFPIVR